MNSEVDYRDKVDELKKIFKNMHTYKDGYITTKDFTNLIKGVNYERSEEHIQSYTNYWEKYHGEKFSLENFLAIFTSLYNTSELARQHAIMADIDKNGFISSHEFQGIANLMCVHDARLAGKSFVEFVQEADTNRDGKVSIDECAVWIEKQINNSSV